MSSASAPFPGYLFFAGFKPDGCCLGVLVRCPFRKTEHRAVLRKAKQEKKYLFDGGLPSCSAMLSHNPFLVPLGGKPLDLPSSLTKVL